MQRATAQARGVLAVLSDRYLDSTYTEDEWTAAHRERKLLLVRVGSERPGGILGPLISAELVDVEEDDARQRLLNAAERFLALQRGEDARAKPKTPPRFPRPAAERPVPERAPFPGSQTLRNLPRGPNPNFTGREEELAAIASAFAEGKRVALTGLGGLGKSRLAIEYAHRHLDEYRIVWWVRAETATTLVEDLAALASAVRLVSGEASNLGEAAQAARRHLEQEAEWLLVFDDAVGPDSIDAYLPKNACGHVIVTSRNRAWRGLASPLDLPVLAPPDAVDFLRRRSGDADAGGAAEDLVEELGCLPLALEQAGAYIEENGSTVAAYLDTFRTHRAEILAEGELRDYPAPVATAWELSFRAIEEDAPVAAVLLELLAFLAPDDIPTQLFIDHETQLPGILAEAASRPLALDRELAGPLLRYSLVQREGESFSVHRLVQAVTQDRVPGERRRDRAAEAVSLLTAAFAFDQADPSGWGWCGRLLPHALIAAGHAESLGVADRGASTLLNRAGLYLRSRAEFSSAQATLERALAIDEQVYGQEHPRVATSANNLGTVLRVLGDIAGARAAFERALAIGERVYGPEHPSIAIRVNNLALVLLDLGDLAGARAALERALAIDERVYGAEHPKVAVRVNNLGSVLRNLGDLAGARAAFERALAIDERVYGAEHPRVATEVNNVGSVLRASGDLAGARAAFERALAIDERVYGAEHPEVAIDVNNVGSVLRDLGDLAGARAAFERALAIDERVYGPKHPEVAIHLNNLALVLLSLGDSDGARVALERALTIDERVYGAEHPKVAIRVNNLGRVLQSFGDLAGARSAFERALAIFKASLGHDHSSTRAVRSNLRELDELGA